VDAILAKLVVAVGIFALPSTVLSLFSGQHSWYNISYGEKLPYIKCHADIYDEYLMSHVHGSLSGGDNTAPQGGSAANDACYACHRAVYTNRITYASGLDRRQVKKCTQRQPLHVWHAMSSMPHTQRLQQAVLKTRMV